MTNERFLGLLVSFLGCLFVGKSAADEVKEVAVIGAPTDANKFRLVGSLAFTADGSRLVVAEGMAQDPANPTKINQWASWVMWDVAKKQQISFGPPGGTVAWITADGRYVIGRGIIWDGVTGKAIPSPPDQLKVSFDAQAPSPDGAYLAVAFNEYNPRHIKKLPVAQPRLESVKSRFGTIAVWDLKARKMKWRIPGAEGEIQSRRNLEVRRLAFSPDGTRLATIAGNKLNVFGLESGSDAPALKMTSDQKFLSQRIGDGDYESYTGPATQFELRWAADGKSLLLRNRTEFEFLDAATGARKEKFDLKTPPKPPKPSPAKLPPGKVPKAGGESAPPPPEPVSYASSLSADAKLLASAAVEQVGDKLGSITITIWDVAARRRQAILKFPMEKLWGSPAIALSPNGKQLAVSDKRGAVLLYDVGQARGDTEIGEANPLPVGSIWKGTKHRDQGNHTMPATLKIAERDGTGFKGTFSFDQKNVGEVAGTIADGKIEWNVTKTIKGVANQPTSGTLKGVKIDAKFNGTNDKDGGASTGTIDLTRSE